MKIQVNFDQNVLPDAYGKGASVTYKHYAITSFPFEVSDLPQGTKTLAWSFVDYDSIPVCGFAYIHWVVANVPAKQTVIPENFAKEDKTHTHGYNSLVSKFLTEDYTAMDKDYLGPYPPDKDHNYTLTVYALDSELPLQDGFYLNELKHLAKDHILAQATINLIGKA